MGLRTTIAFAITVGVIGAAAALAWSERRIATDRGHQVRDEQRRASVGPAGSMENEGLFSSGPLDQLVVDPPDAAWRAEPSTPVLSCDAALAPAKLRIGTGRWSGTGSDGGLDYKEYEKYDARLNQKLDGSHTLVVWAGGQFGSESWAIELPPQQESGPCNAGRFSSGSSCVYAQDSRKGDELHGTLKLSELPSAVGQTLFFELRVAASPNRRIHAEGPVTVRRATE